MVVGQGLGDDIKIIYGAFHLNVDTTAEYLSGNAQEEVREGRAVLSEAGTLTHLRTG